MRTKQYNVSDVGRRIKQRRVERNMTMDDLAEKIGVAKSTIVRIENGSYLPSLLVFANICEVLYVDMDKICRQDTTNTNNAAS